MAMMPINHCGFFQIYGVLDVSELLNYKNNNIQKYI